MNELKDLVDLYLELESEIVGYWEVFITVNTVIFGWLVTKKGRHRAFPRVMATVAYGFFAVLVYFTLEGNAPMFEAVRHDLELAAEAKDLFVKETQLQEQLINLPEKGWDDYGKWIYIVSALGVAGFILLDKLSRPEEGQESKIQSTGNHIR